MYSNVTELQIANGDVLLKQHIKKNHLTPSAGGGGEGKTLLGRGKFRGGGGGGEFQGGNSRGPSLCMKPRDIYIYCAEIKVQYLN